MTARQEEHAENRQSMKELHDALTLPLSRAVTQRAAGSPCHSAPPGLRVPGPMPSQPAGSRRVRAPPVSPRHRRRGARQHAPESRAPQVLDAGADAIPRLSPPDRVQAPRGDPPASPAGDHPRTYRRARRHQSAAADAAQGSQPAGPARGAGRRGRQRVAGRVSARSRWRARRRGHPRRFRAAAPSAARARGWRAHAPDHDRSCRSAIDAPGGYGQISGRGCAGARRPPCLYRRRWPACVRDGERFGGHRARRRGLSRRRPDQERGRCVARARADTARSAAGAGSS